jgi:glycosyltransferase involved in cell wall biosynthesis
VKFSIVTPSSNSARFLRETIDSVISQRGDFSIEYTVVDNGSTDGTAAILEEYERTASAGSPVHCRGVSFRWLSEKDDGMYDAVNKGFRLATGDVYAWINADDIYLPGAFDGVARTLKQYPRIRWIKGITSYIDETSSVIEWGRCNLYDRRWIASGIYGREAYFIQQDSVFWTPDLWREAGGVDARYRRAGDYDLWIRFSRLAPLHSLNRLVSCFRRSEGQLSGDFRAYIAECDRIVPPDDSPGRRRIRRYFAREDRIPAPLRPVVYRLLFGKQDLAVVELRDGGAPVLRKASYCRL